jgi:hypothetical protein
MSMYKRPLPRARNTQKTHHPVKVSEGTFLHGLLNPSPPRVYKYVPAPVYEQKAYLNALEKHYKQCGIPFKDPQLPDSVKIVTPEPTKEPELVFLDQVYLKMRILKSGIVRIKLDASIATLHEKYYKKALRPPMKSILSAYKSMGFSPQFLEKIKKRFEWKVKEQKRIEKVIDKIFNKEPVKKVKKKKKEEEEEPVEEPPEEDEEDKDDAPEEDEGLDVEPDADEDVEEPVDEEEYLSD